MKNSKKPQISVAMSFYKESLGLAKSSLESVLKQTYRNFELIVILDNPGNKKIESYIKQVKQKDKRIIFLKNKENKGLAYCRNRAIKLAKADFIAFADGDDINRKDRFQKQISFMKKNKNVDLLFSSFEEIDGRGKVLFKQKPVGSQDLRSFKKRPIKFLHLFKNPTFFGRKKIFEKELFDEKLRRCEDSDMWIRLSGKANFFVIPDILLKRRLRNHRELCKTDFATRKYWIVLLLKHLPRYASQLYYWEIFIKGIAAPFVFMANPEWLVNRSRDASDRKNVARTDGKWKTKI